ncbi:peptide/nickel transport system ATP-binding protein [Paraburkholderia atlantica]|uniref:ABC transporter ATP-binding protein n=1 Tax=Paraburkholderia atlantica TaxID=2654982 RepID=UPI000377DAF4|nr:ABC transporter ATP-binding protein [Paraburkholderia atlantica]
MNGAALLEVEQLDITFAGAHGRASARAVDGLSFEIRAGETLALVGESGCGKSTTALALMGLLDARAAHIEAARLRFAGTDLLELPEASWRGLRGGSIGMIFQDPLAALNPVRTIGRQIGEALKLHRGLSGRAARNETLALLHEVGIPEPARRIDDYPHRLSGGMRQRVVIAMALAGQPRLLIADEPTTALDVTIQAQILALLARLQQQTGMALLLITHDLGIVGQLADRVAVMYAGRKVEERPAAELFDDPRHPYTLRLLQARPLRGGARARLAEIPGAVPAPGAVARGCAFAPRCTFAQAACREAVPAWRQIGEGGVGCVFDLRAGAINAHDRGSHAA